MQKSLFSFFEGGKKKKKVKENLSAKDFSYCHLHNHLPDHIPHKFHKYHRRTDSTEKWKLYSEMLQGETAITEQVFLKVLLINLEWRILRCLGVLLCFGFWGLFKWMQRYWETKCQCLEDVVCNFCRLALLFP